MAVKKIEHLKFWEDRLYIPNWLKPEFAYGLNLEVGRYLNSLPENKPCEDCKKAVWHCTCMVEIDNIYPLKD